MSRRFGKARGPDCQCAYNFTCGPCLRVPTFNQGTSYAPSGAPPAPIPQDVTGPARIVSFGFRHLSGPTAPGVLVLDVRALPGIRNPWTVAALRALSGLDPAVGAYIKTGPGFDRTFQTLLDRCTAQSGGDVFIGCYGGRHRSVYLADALGAYFQVPVVHLHIDHNRERV